MDGEPGDFTMSEGHGHPLVLYNESKHNILALVGKVNKMKGKTDKRERERERGEIKRGID
jgi:hypothetical protein